MVFTNYGSFTAPDDMPDVPRTKDGREDMRYRICRDVMGYVAMLNDVVGKLWASGADFEGGQTAPLTWAEYEGLRK